MRIKESLNVKFDESPPPKSPPLEDDDVLECEIIENQEKVLGIKENEPLNKEIINIKESKDHPIKTVIVKMIPRSKIYVSWHSTIMSGFSTYMTGNKDLFSSYKTIDGGNVVFGGNSKSTIVEKEDYLKEFDPKSTKGIFLRYLPNSKAYIILNKETMRIKESLNVKFDESPPPKSPPLEDDDVLECEIIENQEKVLGIKKNEPLNKEIINIKESKDHPIKTII
nr:retrotransposon protein [Tanacetum cinerariifolium]